MNKMKNLTTVCCVMILTGCGESTYIPPQPEPDQCLRQEIFLQCMKSLPAGPVSTKYNDWDEVVDSCENVAYYQSLRNSKSIKKECSS